MCAEYQGIEIPDNDAERAEALRAYDVLDTAPEMTFDDITEIAAALTGCPAAYIGLFDERRMWLKAKYGLPPDLFERPRELTLCAPTVCQNDVLVIPDLSKEERYQDLPSVAGPPNVRFYCGVPLINPEGYALGTICVFDTKPKKSMSAEHREIMRRLARQVVSLLETRRKVIELAETQKTLREIQGALEREKAETERLLLNILPGEVAAEMKARGEVRPRYCSSATVMFSDFCDFTNLVRQLEPAALVEQLNDYFSAFDAIIERLGLERLKTIGDAYMCAGGVTAQSRNHAVRICLAALEFRQAMEKVNRRRKKVLLDPWLPRIGVHTGPVIAGIVGTQTIAFDIWGDAVNVAARMEQSGECGRIQISEDTFALVSNFFDAEQRGMTEVKNRGAVSTCFLERLKPEYASDESGIMANEKLKVKLVGT